MQTVVKTMDEIADSTQRIGSITKLINDIAFQTNILQSVTDSHPSGILPRMRITGAMLAQRADLYPIQS
jgi:hypothetical protein